MKKLALNPVNIARIEIQEPFMIIEDMDDNFPFDAEEFIGWSVIFRNEDNTIIHSILYEDETTADKGFESYKDSFGFTEVEISVPPEVVPPEESAT